MIENINDNNNNNNNNEYHISYIIMYCSTCTCLIVSACKL